jgi:sugar phosphate isomerase/epimerase
MSTPKVALFLAQPNGALVGEGKPFSNLKDLCRWAHKECGYEGVTAPACLPFVDIDSVLKSDSYPDDLLAGYEAFGTPLLRLEMHTVGQRMLLHPAELARFSMFAGGNLAPTATFREHEAAAEAEALKIVEASAKLGFKHLVDFSGNRGWTAAKYPWSAYPEKWRLYILLLALAKHRRVLARCAELGIARGFELHPGEDINSPLLLFLLRELAKQVAPETVPAIAANADASHPTLAGDDAARHFRFLHKEGLLQMCHLKDGERGESFLAEDSLELRAGSLRGDFAPRWSESWRRFCTFGTGMADWDTIIPILLQAGVDFVVEGECSRFPNMMQALKIGAENARNAINGEPFIQEIEVEEPVGGNWESFCAGPVPAAELLCMDAEETKAVEELRERLSPDILRYF